MSFQFTLLEKGLLPDVLIRWGIRDLLKKKLELESRGGVQAQSERFRQFLEATRKSPISINTDEANAQHYEVPAEFFEKIMGSRMKYSSGYWKDGVSWLNQSEEDMLALTAQRAELRDGQDILELGCGWGSLTLWMAEHFPQSRIVAVSNSKSQKQFIEAKAARLGIRNVTVITCEMSQFHTEETFDRIVTVEMFEHMRNYEKLFEKVSGFLKPLGKLFIHVFSHKQWAYFYEDNGPQDWITRFFFSGGTMPSHHLFLYFQNFLTIENHWQVDGTHYQKTCRAWLENMDRHEKEIRPILKKVYGAESGKWWVYWRVFFMACEELFGYRGGQEWMVSHYLFRKASGE